MAAADFGGMTPYPTDLFGEVPVTWPEVEDWLLAVPQIDPSSRRAEYYVRNWSVPDKIRRAKLAGTFESIVNREAPPSPFWWARMRWDHV